MKTTTLILTMLMVTLLTMGSSCVNEGFVIAVNVPISKCNTFTANSNSYDSGPQSVDLASIVGESFSGKLSQARLYDIKLTYIGPYTGNVSGSVYIGATKVVDYAGPASSFVGGRSLLTSPTLFSNLNAAPLLTALATRPLPVVTIRNTASFTPAPTPGTQHTLCVDILAQADGTVN